MDNPVETVTEDVMDQGMDKLRRQSQRIVREGQGLWSDTTNWVRRSPGEALGVAVGIGAVIGAAVVAMSGRRSRAESALESLTSMGQEGLKPVRSAVDRGLSALCHVLEDLRSSLNR